MVALQLLRETRNSFKHMLRNDSWLQHQVIKAS